MTKNYSLIFREELRPNVFLFDVTMVSADLLQCSLVGSVIINIDSNPNGKAYVSLIKQMDIFSKTIADECLEMSRKIMEVIQPPV